RVDRAVEVTGRYRDLGQLLWSLAGDGPAGRQRQADAAERTLVVVAPVGAVLDDGARHRVEVQQRDVPVGDAVGRREVVEPGSLLAGRAREAHLVAVDAVALVLGAQDIGRPSRDGVVGRDGGREALDPQHPGVGRTGTAGAPLERGFQAQAPRLEVQNKRADVDVRAWPG